MSAGRVDAIQAVAAAYADTERENVSGDREQADAVLIAAGAGFVEQFGQQAFADLLMGLRLVFAVGAEHGAAGD
ncbi:MAG: hypothetical protein M3R02_19055 [Chloroflexota bacterium]|nr:hypothetical protein [Chloroflexota bacterium]